MHSYDLMSDGTRVYSLIVVLLDAWNSFPAKRRGAVAPKDYLHMFQEFLEIINLTGRCL